MVGVPFLLGSSSSRTARTWDAVKRYFGRVEAMERPELPDVDENRYPFRLMFVNGSGLACGLCNNLLKQCAGCEVPWSDAPLSLKDAVKGGQMTLAIHFAERAYALYIKGEAEVPTYSIHAQKKHGRLAAASCPLRLVQAWPLA